MRELADYFSATHSRVSLIMGGLGVCLLAVMAGAAAASDHGLLIVSCMLALAFCAIATAIYMRDPILTLLGLWVIEVLIGPVSAIAGYEATAGRTIRQADEILIVLLVMLTVWRAVEVRETLPPLRFVLPGVGVALFGLLGAVVHNVPLFVAITGAWLGLKLWIMVPVVLLLPWRQEDVRRVYTVVVCVGTIIGLLGLADYATHGAVSNTLHTAGYSTSGYRLDAVRSILPQPGEYSLFMSLLFAFAFSRFATTRRTPDLLFALLFAASVVLSLRLKGVLSIATVVLIVALAQSMTRRHRSMVAIFVGLLVMVGVYSVEQEVIARQVATYTAKDAATPRARLYTTSEQIAGENVPLGVGFGRYASYVSSLHYSPVYEHYELATIYGLSREYPGDITDTSWPAVLGETGLAGFAIYVAGLLLLIGAVAAQFRRAQGTDNWVPLAALCALAVVLVDSLGDPTLFDWLAVTTLALVLGPALRLPAAGQGAK